MGPPPSLACKLQGGRPRGGGGGFRPAVPRGRCGGPCSGPTDPAGAGAPAGSGLGCGPKRLGALRAELTARTGRGGQGPSRRQARAQPGNQGGHGPPVGGVPGALPGLLSRTDKGNAEGGFPFNPLPAPTFPDPRLPHPSTAPGFVVLSGLRRDGGQKVHLPRPGGALRPPYRQQEENACQDLGW